MENTENKSNVAVAEEQTLGTLVLSTALRTLKWILIIAALAATLFCCLFPYRTMSMYRSLNNYEKALVYCDVCLEAADDKEGSEYSALLVNAINMSDVLVLESAGASYAQRDAEKLRIYSEKLATYTHTYKNLPQNVRLARSKAVDDYNIANSAKIYHSQVYNFEAYARARSVFSESILGTRSVGTSVVTYFSMIDSEHMDISAGDVVIAAAELSAYLEYELYRGSGAMYGFSGTSLFVSLAANIGYAFDLTAGLEGIDKLHAVWTLGILANNLYSAAVLYDSSKTDIDMEAEKAACLVAKTVKVKGESITLGSYYDVLLMSYISSN